MNNAQKWEITMGSWIRGVAVVAIAYALYLVSEFILVIIASVVIASSIEPAITAAKRRSIPRLPAVILVYLISTLVFASLFYFLLLPLAGEISSFIRTLTIYSNSVTNGGILSELFQTQNPLGGLGTPTIIKELSTQLNILTGFLSQGIFSSVSLIFGGVLNFILVLVISFYLAAQDDGISKFLKTITPIKHEDYVIGLWNRSRKKIGLWMQGQIISSAFLFILVYIALLIVGMPHALLLAVLAGVFELIPIFGTILAAIPTLFVAYTWGGVSVTLIVAGLYFLIQEIEAHIIYPTVQKKLVGIPPLVSIISLVVGASLAGFFGILIAVPLAAALIELISDFEERKIAQMSGTGPVN